MDKYHLLRAMDVAVGTHAHLTSGTRVWNPSHHRLTLLGIGNTPKYHHDDARGYAPPGRNNLPCVIFRRIGTEEDKLSIL
jgi:hypothetical protein